MHEKQPVIRWWDLLAIFGVTAAARLLYYYLGIVFDARPLRHFMQFMDVELLTGNLLQSLWYYHANPPLLNLFAGVTLKLFGDHSSAAFAVMFHLLGLLCAVSLFAVTINLSRSRAIAFVLTGLFVFSPPFVLYENWLMYTFPAAALLAISACALLRYAQTGSMRWGLAFFASVAVVALTRSMFHLAWALVTLGMALFILRHHFRTTMIAALLPMLLIGLWYGKNLYLFNTFTASTWLGLGFSNITTLRVSKEKLEPLVAQGTLTEWALVSRYKDIEKLFETDEVPLERIPILHNPVTSTTTWNFNHINLVAINRHYTHDALQVIRHFPAEYAQGVLTANRLFFSPAGMNYYFSRESRFGALRMDAFYNPWVYGARWLPETVEQPHYGFTGWKQVEVNPGMLLFVGMFAMVIYGLFRLCVLLRQPGQAARAEAMVIAYLLFNVVYIYALSTLFEFAENYRYRFIQEPLVIMLLGAFLADMKRFRLARKTTG